MRPSAQSVQARHHLAKPQLMTSKARIVTVTDTMEGIFFLFLMFHKCAETATFKVMNVNIKCCPGHANIEIANSWYINLPLLLFVLFFFLGISTYCKHCSTCGMVYRYQEWSDRVHNFDDHTILSLHLCVFLQNTLQVETFPQSFHKVSILSKT